MDDVPGVLGATGLLCNPDVQKALWRRILNDVQPSAEQHVTVFLSYSGEDSGGQPDTLRCHVTFERKGSKKLVIVMMHQVYKDDGVDEWEYENPNEQAFYVTCESKILQTYDETDQGVN